LVNPIEIIKYKAKRVKFSLGEEDIFRSLRIPSKI
jgi:hypothetical protein